jgi:hypothetical protein
LSGAGDAARCYGDVVAWCAHHTERSRCFFSELLSEMLFTCRELSSCNICI